MSRPKTIGLWVMAFVYVIAGVNHLIQPEFYLAIIPPSLPHPEWLNLMSGLIEITLGVFLLEPRVRPFAAWAIIALLIAIFPANLYMATENIGTGGPGTGVPLLNWVRLPFQGLFIAWAWWYTD